uniref:TATA-binding protein interacting (TIP20) domain-containing protein n=1 Tax=Timspurckia oligopyrenoides TaxID=708627 RepID=A0A7S1ETS8_9RHOD|mmetsp:Transcript_7381/g.13323  ORF Transcript_7381/g.13323 Transcript_7381/m.13323 type:complete len:457 (+) Transcript_7381:3-1373(+)
MVSQKQLAIAKCIPIFFETYADSEREQIVSMMLENLHRNDKPSLALYSSMCLCELSRNSLLKSSRLNADIRESLLRVISGSTDDSLKRTSASALGVTVAKDPEGMRALFSIIAHQVENRYLHLCAVKEAIIATEGRSRLFDSEVLELLISLNEAPLENRASDTVEAAQKTSDSSSGEDSIRAVLADCTGRICVMDPDLVFPYLDKALASPASQLRAFAAASLRCVAEISQGDADNVDRFLQERMPSLLKLLSDSSINVLFSALICLNIYIRSKWYMLAEYRSSIFNALRDGVSVKQHLIRTVNLGPFKYTEDDGLPLRKTSFECLISLVKFRIVPATSEDTVPIFKEGLRDHADVRTLAHLYLDSLIRKGYISLIVPCISDIVEAFNERLNEKPKPNAVRQEEQQRTDAIRSIIRSSQLLNNVPEISLHPDFISYLQTMLKNPEHSALYTAISSEN